MKVWILTREPCHDNSTVIGVYLTEAAARAAALAVASEQPELGVEDQWDLLEWDTEAQAAGEKATLRRHPLRDADRVGLRREGRVGLASETQGLWVMG